jgi:SSS family solute:Na+ symporter
MVAMLAALMSTLEALINAVSAVVVNDIWKPFVKSNAEDRYYLRVARYVAVVSNVLGIVLIPLFASFGSIYQALAHFTAITTPPLVVVIVLGATWKRYTASAAFWTLVTGSGLLIASLFIPGLISPLAHGEAVVAGAPPWEQHSYMRSLFGLVVCLLLSVAITLATRPKAESEIVGLTLSSVEEARKRFKGGEPNDENPGVVCRAAFRTGTVSQGFARLPKAVVATLAARPGDLIYVSDARWWLGGLRSVHLRLADEHSADECIELAPDDIERGCLLATQSVSVEKMM